MKKLILSILIAGCATFAAKAQNVKFGVKGGLNVATLSDLDDANSKISGHIGGFANIKFKSNMAIQPELLFSGQGVAYDLPGDDGRIALNYINIPVTFQYYFMPQFYAEAGPQLGFLVSAKNKAGDVSIDVKDDFKTVDVGSVIGAGYNFPFNLGVYARINLGFVDLVDGNSDPRNVVFQTGVSYTFGK